MLERIEKRWKAQAMNKIQGKPKGLRIRKCWPAVVGICMKLQPFAHSTVHLIAHILNSLQCPPFSCITGQNGVHLVREISPWSSQVLCIGLAQNLKPILSYDKYWNINPNISAFGMWLICDNTWMYNIQAYAWMYHIQAFAWPQIWPNPIPNPIHGCNTFKIFEHMYALKYQQIWPNPISNPIHGCGVIKF